MGCMQQRESPAEVIWILWEALQLQDGIDNNSGGEEWTMCVQTAKPYVEPSNDVDIDGNK